MTNTARMILGSAIAWLSLGFNYSLYAQIATPPATSNAAMDRDLLEVTIPRLEQMYRAHKYTVTQVVEPSRTST